MFVHRLTHIDTLRSLVSDDYECPHRKPFSLSKKYKKIPQSPDVSDAALL